MELATISDVYGVCVLLACMRHDTCLLLHWRMASSEQNYGTKGLLSMRFVSCLYYIVYPTSLKIIGHMILKRLVFKSTKHSRQNQRPSGIDCLLDLLPNETNIAFYRQWKCSWGDLSSKCSIFLQFGRSPEKIIANIPPSPWLPYFP